MTDYLIANGTASQLTAVNGASVNVAAYSVSAAVTLTSTELVALLTNAGVAVTKISPTSSQRHWVAKILKIGRNPGA